MKKYIILLVATIILGFVAGNKASGQPGCENCFAPWLCSTFTTTVNCNGVVRTIEVTVCYYCYLTRPEVDVEVLSIRGIPVGGICWEIAQDAVSNWILEHGMELCGNLPCDVGRKTFKISYPICADLVYHENGTYDFFPNQSCEKKCSTEVSWCWCNCTPDCDPSQNCTPHIVFYPPIGQWIWFPEGNGNCEYLSTKPGEQRECQKFKSKCNPNDGFPP
ncbi:hypothetical protein D9V84_11195 [Bacteroidetes/Chlorobi group bacterium Naka2016]|jgi:hypothetical protein|nr:MAG: hypothetical protein D9V84_11195 [Bacteroidetes/Chlorobi group bacterium Naka2016]